MYMKKDNNNLFIPIDLDIERILAGNFGPKEPGPFTFLVGAGVSVNYPSCLPSATQIKEAIIKWGSSQDAVNEILNINYLRYEIIFKLFRDFYDPELNLLKIFEKSNEPNVIHQYIAKMSKQNSLVLTTNFDYLLETAIGLEEKKLVIVITPKDFDSFNYGFSQNPPYIVYKLHGSLKNPKQEKILPKP